MSADALSVQQIGFNYGQRVALDNVSFTVSANETVVLLGPNGAGKTTLFSILCGLFAAASGTVKIADKVLRTAGSAALAPLGIVFQAQTLDLDLTVKQNLLYFCSLHGMHKDVAVKSINESLERLGMLDRLDDKVRALNGGHRRRVEIARATLHNPKLLLLDEPTVGLDIPTRRALIGHLHDLHSQSDIALLWATHLVDEVDEQDRVIILHQGRIVADGKPGELMQQAGVDSLEAAFDSFTVTVAA